MKLLSFKLSFIVLLGLPFFTNAQTISPNLVGTNLWYNPSTAVWNLTKDCGIQMIRIGGAEYDRNMPSNATILAWVKQIRAIGAEPVVQVSEYKSAALAASLVTYLNVTNKNVIAPVKYWNIGNEPWLQNYSLAAGIDLGKMVETYFKPIAAAMKAADPTIKIYGPDECYYADSEYNDLFGGKNDISGKVPDKDYYYCDGITWHNYPQDVNLNLAYGGIDAFKSTIVKCKQKVDQVNALHNRTGDNAMSWGIGEYNAEQASKVHSFENGQMFGGILGLSMKYEAKYTTSWSMFEAGGSRTGSDKSYIDGNMKPRASYWHMQFVAKYFKGKYVDGISSSNDFVVYGAKYQNQVSVMIMHRATGNPKEYKLTLDNSTPAGAAYALKLNADTTLTYGDMIGERTTHVIIFRGDSVIKIKYSSDDFDKQIAPTVSTVKASTQLPNTPSGFKAIPASFSSINLSWNDDSDNEFGYIIEREVAGIFKTIGMTSPNVKSYTDSGLAAETSYKYRIVAYNSLGKSEYSAVGNASTLAIPAAKAFNGPHAIPGKTEAEDFDANGEGLSYHDLETANQGLKYRTTEGVDIESSTDLGLGYNTGYTADGEWLSYLIESVTPGIYDIALRLSSNENTITKRIDVYIDNVKVGNVVPPYTAGWQIWATKYIKNIDIKDNLPKKLKLVMVGGSFNLNWIQFGAGLSTSVGSIPDTKMSSWYDGINQQINVQSSETLKGATIQVFNSLGQSFYKSNYTDSNSMKIDAALLPKGIYLVSISNKKEYYTTKITIL